jgi:hypothetical protein
MGSFGDRSLKSMHSIQISLVHGVVTFCVESVKPANKCITFVRHLHSTPSLDHTSPNADGWG